MAHIYGERVYLRAIEADEWEYGYRWINDPEVAQYLLHFFPFSRMAERSWYESAASGKSNTERNLAIVLREDDQYIGNISLMNIDWKNRSGELGIMIGEKDCWGKGYGTDALKTLLQFGFGELGLHRIYLRVFEDNRRAQRAYTKAGFTKEGVFRQDRWSKGQFHDTIVMSILAPEFLNAQA